MKPNLDTLKLSCRTKHLKHRPVPLTLGDFAAPEEFIRLDPWEAEYVHMIASMSNVGIVETGRYYGGSTFLMGCATDKPIHSFDISPQDDEYLQELFEQHHITNCHLYVDDSNNTDMTDKLKYDILFVDGDHSYQGCYNDLVNWWDNLTVGGHVLLHDSYVRYTIPQAITNFIQDKNARVYVSPFNSLSTWDSQWGSICHFQKLS
jgi:predicted O-methyltransferase YrrM